MLIPTVGQLPDQPALPEIGALVTVTDHSSVAQNRLLAALPPEELERLLLHCQQVILPPERVLLAPREEVRYAYFPLDGVISLLMVMEDGTPVELISVGNEGFVSIESILSTDQSPFKVSCQTRVEALRADVDGLRAAFHASGPLRDLLLRYAALVFRCTGRSLACKVTHPVEQRLACWLLMTRDRVRANELPFTHQTLARILGVHRPTISVAAEALCAHELITYHRGQITIVDRAGLEAASCEHYGEFRRVYQELLGPIIELDEPSTRPATMRSHGEPAGPLE